jgi:hypothetical protein
MLSQFHAQAVSEIQAAFANKVARIRADQGLTARERQRQLAKAVLAARDILAQVRSDSDAQSAAVREKAFREAFAIHPSRGAEDRELRAAIARSAPSAVETRDRMLRAISIGDLMEARALAAYAYEHRDDQLGGEWFRGSLNLYGGASPDFTRQLTALRDADAAIGGGSDHDSRVSRFTDKLSSEISIPDEVSHGSLESLAADETPYDGPPQGMPFGIGGNVA